jgi:hypothetical protein
MHPRLVFVTRQSPDWQSLAADYAAGTPIDPARFIPPIPVPGFPENLAELIGLWNSRMGIDFFNCRAALKRITDDSIAKIPGALRLSYEIAHERIRRGDNCMVFFHDDDDWFAPDMAERVPITDSDVCVFPLVRLQGPDTLTFVHPAMPARLIVGRRENSRMRYLSNNYGIMGRACDAETLFAMKDHVLASRYANVRCLRDTYTDQIVSATAKTPVAASMLKKFLFSPKQARIEIRRYVLGLRALQIPDGLDWIAARVPILIDLFSQATQ